MPFHKLGTLLANRGIKWSADEISEKLASEDGSSKFIYFSIKLHNGFEFPLLFLSIPSQRCVYVISDMIVSERD